MKKNGALKKLRVNQKQVYQEQSQAVVDATYNTKTYAFKLAHYRELKKLKWWHWLITGVIVIFGVGLSFLTGYLTLHSAHAPNWQGTGWFAIAYTVTLIVANLILGWIKNKKAVKFFNDRRRRYQRTLTDEEARIQLVRKILFFSFLPMLILSIVTTVVF